MSHNRRAPLPLVLGFTVTLMVAGLNRSSACAASPDEPRPNIVFILADDLGINDLSCYGRKDQPTPHLDRLAQQGMRFTMSYAAQSVCSPTRAALMTGLTPARLHLTTFLPGRPDTPGQLLLHPKIDMQLSRKYKTVAELLKGAGYATACLGKWHLGGQGFLPSDRGFDLYFPGHANTKPSATEGGKGEYELTARAEKWIEDNKDRPFFLYLAHNSPHVTLAAKPELIDKHKEAFNPVYAAMLETLDDCVSRVVAKVDALGLAERTLIVFNSDNGGLHVLEGVHTPATHNTPYRAGKGFYYEGGIRVPLIVRWPGKVKAGAVVDTPVISTDWTPTLLALTGNVAPEKLDGVSLAGLLLRGEPLAPRPLFWHIPHYTNQGSRPSGAIREGDWKLIEHYEDGRCELFNLVRDSGETTDLSAKEPARVADLRGKLEKWRREVGAQENTANPAFNACPWRRLYHDVDPSRIRLDATASAMAAKLETWRKLMNDVLPGRGRTIAPDAGPGPGAILLHARDAKVHGGKLHYEAEPYKDTLGFWTQREDWAEWNFEGPHAGAFAVELLQWCGIGSAGAEVEVTVAGQTLALKVEETGHFQRFVPRTAGTVELEMPGRYTLTVKAKTKPGAGVMDLRRVLLRAAP
jgi:arylsulfatase A-like enzyme